jgi:peptidoglycan/LPS O-acetylase OafA/YrhL
MFWLAIIFYTFVFGTESTPWSPHGVSAGDIASNVIFMHGWHPDSINSVVPGGWSIAVEMNFYLLLPVLFLWITDLRRALWLAVMALIFSIGADRFLQDIIQPHVAAANLGDFLSFRLFWLPSQLPIFALGAVLFHILGLPAQSGAKARSLSWLLGIVAILLVASGPSRFLRHDMIFGLALFLAAWAIAIQPVGILVNRVTRYLGKISYSGYLTHSAVVLLTIRLLYHGSPHLGGVTTFTILVAVSFVLTVIFSTVTYQLVEVPGQAFGKWLIAHTVNRPASADRTPTASITMPQLAPMS